MKVRSDYKEAIDQRAQEIRQAAYADYPLLLTVLAPACNLGVTDRPLTEMTDLHRSGEFGRHEYLMERFGLEDMEEARAIDKTIEAALDKASGSVAWAELQLGTKTEDKDLVKALMRNINVKAEARHSVPVMN